jgi:molecular chaperone DnaK
VIDFGGGTLDVALVDKDGIQEPWGNPILGGRLFDDLFYQWLIENNPKIDLHGFSDDDLMSAWCVGCRKLKEDFSRHWRRRGVGTNFTDFRGGVCLQTNEVVGRLQNASLSEFRERASTYRPTDIAQRYFSEVGGNLGSIGIDGPIDLLKLVRDALSNSGRVDRKSRDYSLVILTGGSSSWPFMSELAADVFDVATEQIISSASPEVTIGQGLAIYNVIRDRHRGARKRIESERAEGRQTLIKQVDKKLASFSNEIAKSVSTKLMTQVRPIYLAWYREGGRLIDVEKKAAKLCHDFAPERLVEQRWGQLKQEITHLTIVFVADWLKGHGIKVNLETVAFALSSSGLAKSSEKLDVSTAIEDGIAGSFTAMLAGVVAIIGGMLAGGGGVALIATGPVGWLIGAVIAFGAVFGLHGQIKERVKTYTFEGISLSFLHRLVKEEKLNEKFDEAEAMLSASLSEKIGKEMEANKKDLIRYLDQSIELGIKRFGALEQISPLH